MKLTTPDRVLVGQSTRALHEELMKKLYIGKNSDSPVLAYENALTCYVYGRVSFNTQCFLFLLPSTFYLFHHSIEVSIKTLLRLKDIKYPYDLGVRDGHKTRLLLSKVVDSKLYSEAINQLLNDDSLIKLLEVMDNSYMDNKYEYPGYSLSSVPIRDLVDNLIYTIFVEINSILESKKHVLAVLNVPISVEKTFLYKLNTKISYCVLESRND